MVTYIALYEERATTLMTLTLIKDDDSKESCKNIKINPPSMKVEGPRTKVL